MAQPVQHIVIRIDDYHTLWYSSSPVVLNVQVILGLCSPPCSSCSPAWQLDPIFIFSWAVTKNLGFYQIHPSVMMTTVCWHNCSCYSHKQQRLQSLQNLGKYSLLLLLSSWASNELDFNWKPIFQSLWYVWPKTSKIFLMTVCCDPLESSLISILQHLWVSQQHM